MELPEELRADFKLLEVDGSPWTSTENPDRFIFEKEISTNQYGKIKIFHPRRFPENITMQHVDSGLWIVPTTLSTLKLISALVGEDLDVIDETDGRIVQLEDA